MCCFVIVLLRVDRQMHQVKRSVNRQLSLKMIDFWMLYRSKCLWVWTPLKVDWFSGFIAACLQLFCFCLHGLQPSVRDSILFLINWHLLVVQREGCINIYVYVYVCVCGLAVSQQYTQRMQPFICLQTVLGNPTSTERYYKKRSVCMCMHVCVYKYVSVSLNLSTPSRIQYTHTTCSVPCTFQTSMFCNHEDSWIGFSSICRLMLWMFKLEIKRIDAASQHKHNPKYKSRRLCHYFVIPPSLAKEDRDDLITFK